MNSQLSIARYYGGCRINGEEYIVDYSDGSLVSTEYLKAEEKARADKEAADWKPVSAATLGPAPGESPAPAMTTLPEQKKP